MVKWKDEMRYECQKKRSNIYFFIKRVTDVLVALPATLLLWPVLIILCCWIMIADRGNPFYIQMRVGENGKELPVVKLRSMKRGADDLENTLNAEQLKVYRQEYKLDNDPRLIGWNEQAANGRCFGAFIRQLSLDELPQLFWNVLIKGNMALVGPRPILREELEKHYTKEEQEVFLSVKPGLTGYWQAYARNNATYETGERQRMELYYVQNQSIWMDIKIMFATVGAVLARNGAK